MQSVPIRTTRLVLLHFWAQWLELSTYFFLVCPLAFGNALRFFGSGPGVPRGLPILALDVAALTERSIAVPPLRAFSVFRRFCGLAELEIPSPTLSASAALLPFCVFFVARPSISSISESWWPFFMFRFAWTACFRASLRAAASSASARAAADIAAAPSRRNLSG